jgi:hypothetical protein
MFVVNLYLGSNFSNGIHFAEKPDERNGPRVGACVRPNNKEPTPEDLQINPLKLKRRAS